MLIAAVSVTGGMIAQRRAYIPEIEVIDAEEETAEVTAAVTYTESISTAEASALSEVNIVPKNHRCINNTCGFLT